MNTIWDPKTQPGVSERIPVAGFLASKLRVWLTLTVIGMCAYYTPRASAQPAAKNTERAPIVVSEQALQIHRRSYVFDGHNDLPWAIRTDGSRSFEVLDIAKPQPKLHTDIARLREGGVGAQYWSVYVPANTAESGKSHQMTLEQIEIVRAMCEKYPEEFQLCLTRADIERT